LSDDEAEGAAGNKDMLKVSGKGQGKKAQTFCNWCDKLTNHQT